MSEELEVLNPYDLKSIKSIPLQSAEDVERALATAYKLHKGDVIPKDQRIAILKRMILEIEKNKDVYIKDALSEGGKPYLDSKVEVERGMQGVQVAIEELGQMRGQEIPMGINTGSLNRLAYTMKEPIGVVVAVSAFNHPFNLIIHQVIPAIAAGCPVIVKPASATPLSCYNVVNCLISAGLPKEWCQIINCKRDVAEKLLTDPRISFLTFIGSGKVGWSLKAKLPAGAHCALEHGGAAPVIVEPDADIESMLPLLVKGGFYHAGQVCVSVQRIFAHQSIAKDLAEGLAASAKKLIVGDPLQESTEVGPLISTREVDRVATWVESAKKTGAQVLSGGERLSETCYSPTVLFDPAATEDVSRKEIFGPVVCVYPYSDRLEAIERANSLPFSFQASVFTKHLDVALDTVKRLEATAVMVNDHTAFRVDWMPFGGHQQSGMGVGGIGYSMRDMTKEKLMVIKSPVL